MPSYAFVREPTVKSSFAGGAAYFLCKYAHRTRRAPAIWLSLDPAFNPMDPQTVTLASALVALCFTNGASFISLSNRFNYLSVDPASTGSDVQTARLVTALLGLQSV